MSPLTILVWLLECSMTLANISSTEYDATRGCDVTYGNELETLTSIRSVTECSEMCNLNDNCLSVKYYPDKKMCKLNSEPLPSLNTDCTAMLRFAELTKMSPIRLINEHCKLSNGCLVSNSQCYKRTCQCNPEYSYKHSTGSCVTSCDVYGSSFTVFQDRHHTGHDDKVVYGVNNATLCEPACIAETTFVCGSTEHIIRTDDDQYCVLLKVINPGSILYASGASYHRRNCQ